MLTCGMPFSGSMTALANPEPQQSDQSAGYITGTVLDENGEPLIGANVAEKGKAANITSTNANGHFSLRVKPGTPLTISYVGYKTATVPASNKMEVILLSNTEDLDEVVVVGYGTQRRVNLTGAVSTVDVGKTLESRPQQDVAKALQGAVPGLTILSSNGNITTASPSIKIRGTGTLSNSATSTPLIVVDGVPVDDMSYLNPEDIQDISVLKDAASSSIYGTRAAFGVILITTKQGKKGDRMQIKYSNNFGFSQATTTPEPVDGVTQLETSNQAAKRLGAAEGEFFGMYYTDILPYAREWQKLNGTGKGKGMREAKPFIGTDLSNYTQLGDYYVNANGGGYLPYSDWDIRKIFYNEATPSNSHNVSIQGNTGKATYNVSFGYNKRQSVLNYNPDKVHRYNVNANFQVDLTSWLTAGVRFNFTQRNVETPNFGSNTFGTIWRFPAVISMMGYVLDENGDRYYTRNNEVGYLEQAYAEQLRRNYTRMQGYIKADLYKGLTLNADFTYSIINYNSEYAYLPVKVWNSWSRSPFNSLYDAVTQTSTTSTKENSYNHRWTMNVYGAYDFTVAKDNNFKIMIGATAEQNRYSYLYGRTKVLLDNNLPAMNLYSGDLVAPASEDSHWATAGWFGRINYDYKGIYLLELNGRYDGSSRFPANDQWAFFPSMSLGYRFSEEAYFKKLKDYVNNGKLRFSYGEIGNQAIGNNMFISTIGTENISYLINGQTTLLNVATLPTLVSSALSWERIRTTDVGLDLGLLNNEINLSFDWYQRDTKDMLAPGVTLPGVLGASAPYTNQGSLRTRGWELGVNWNRTFGEWNVYANFNIGDAKTIITNWNNPTMGLSSNYSGKEYGVIWGFETDRYFTEDDFVRNADGSFAKTASGAYIPKEGIASQQGLEQDKFHYGPGDVKFKDLNGDGVISGGNADMIELNGQYFVPTDAGYAAALANPNHTTVAVGSVNNHGDIKKIGNSLPRYEYSFHLGANWRGFDLDVFFQGVGKRDWWAVSSMTQPYAQAANDILYTHMTSHNNQLYDENWNIIGWEIDQNNDFPCLYPGSYADNNVPSLEAGRNNFIPQTRYLLDLSYLRVKNVTFGYTIPKNITKKAYIEKLRVYFSGDNLFFVHNGNSKYGLDPEITSTEWSGANTWGRANPMLRTYSFGLQVTF